MKRLPFFRRPRFAGRIIEIGGGHDPYQGVTHAVDKFPGDNSQRAGNMVTVQGAVFVEGELESIPFPDEPRFDFLYASHVLEHVQSPQKAVAEINRVARRGYLETPSPLREQIICLFPYDSAKDFHVLFCWTGLEPHVIHVMRRWEKTVGSFCSCRNGRTAKILFDLRQEKKVDVERLIPNRSKTTKLFFKSPLQLMQHEDFESACRDGFCAYSDVRFIGPRLKPPFCWFSKRARELKKLLISAES